MKIKSISAQEILDSRGNPTVEAVTILEDESAGLASVPSGASTGKYEAVELRDHDENRFGGLGVLKAIENVNSEIANHIIGLDAQDQRLVDQTLIKLDGTENKSRLGANAMLAASLSVAKAQCLSEKKELFDYLVKYNPDFDGNFIMPIPEMNVMNGGKHANFATDIQEYMLFPIGAFSFADAVCMNAEVYQKLKDIIKTKGYSISVGDEGGFAPNVGSNEEPFQLLTEAVEKSGHKIGDDISFGIDAASSEFFENGIYNLKKEGRDVNSDELSDFYSGLVEKYPIVSIEDPFAEDDWEAFQKFAVKFGEKLQIVGDDLYVTNVKRLEIGIEKNATNTILIKLNQIGTLSETIDAILLARRNNMKSIVSHRSGETEDTFIADLAVAMGVGQIKSGAPARSERVAKYNRLMRIERMLGEKATYPSSL